LNFEFFRGLTVRGYATLCVALVRYLKSIISTTTLKSEHIIAKVSALLYPLHNFGAEGITMYKVWLKSIEGC
jgi:hypothetical protein